MRRVVAKRIAKHVRELPGIKPTQWVVNTYYQQKGPGYVPTLSPNKYTIHCINYREVYKTLKTQYKRNKRDGNT